MSRQQMKIKKHQKSINTFSVNRVWQEIQMLAAASIRNAFHFVQQHPGQSIVLIYFLIFSCNCINNVYCDIEPRPANSNFDDDDDDAARTLVSLRFIYKH